MKRKTGEDRQELRTMKGENATEVRKRSTYRKGKKKTTKKEGRIK